MSGSDKKEVRILIIGAGITGLLIAHGLQQVGFALPGS
jgi:glycine/D-amino acid oxidase-like deaminating enzyme